MTAAKVSVVIPAYEVSRYIGETLDSVHAQTFSDHEIIVVDDGSPDAAELARALEPHLDRIRLITQENLGASAARNAGLRAARGRYAAFLDGDDAWLPGYLESQLAFLERTGCDLVCADAAVFGEGVEEGPTFMQLYMDDAPAEGEASFLDLLSARRCLITSGVVVDRARVLEAGLFDLGLRNAQDYDLWLRLANGKARLGFHRRTLLRHRIRVGSLTGDGINANRRDLRVFEKIERSYAFAPAERESASAVIRERRASLQFEIGKQQLLDGDYADARRSFAESSRHGRGWKSRLALGLTRAAPALMRTLYARHVERLRG